MVVIGESEKFEGHFKVLGSKRRVITPSSCAVSLRLPSSCQLILFISQVHLPSTSILEKPTLHSDPLFQVHPPGFSRFDAELRVYLVYTDNLQESCPNPCYPAPSLILHILPQPLDLNLYKQLNSFFGKGLSRTTTPLGSDIGISGVNSLFWNSRPTWTAAATGSGYRWPGPLELL